jgi:multiple antibiotic resistance protein
MYRAARKACRSIAYRAAKTSEPYRQMPKMLDTYLLMLAALFPVVNPPGSALVFLALTKRAPTRTRRALARRVSINAFFVMAGSLLIGASILQIYGITVPVLRVAGGLVVAASGWRLLNTGSTKEEDALASDSKSEYANQAFYPLTLPLTTGPGTIAVTISLGLTRLSYASSPEHIEFLISGLLATLTIASAVYFCFSFSDRVEKVLGRGGTDIAVRLSAFILFCLGVQIVWSGATDLLKPLMTVS